MASIFKSGKVWIFAAATAVAGTIAGYSWGRASRNWQNLGDKYNAEDLAILRKHVHQEGLTLYTDRDGKRLTKYDRQGNSHPIRVSELEDGRTQIEMLDSAPIPHHSHSSHSSHADKIIAERTAASEATPGMVK